MYKNVLDLKYFNNWLVKLCKQRKNKMFTFQFPLETGKKLRSLLFFRLFEHLSAQQWCPRLLEGQACFTIVLVCVFYSQMAPLTVFSHWFPLKVLYSVFATTTRRCDRSVTYSVRRSGGSLLPTLFGRFTTVIPAMNTLCQNRYTELLYHVNINSIEWIVCLHFVHIPDLFKGICSTILLFKFGREPMSMNNDDPCL